MYGIDWARLRDDIVTDGKACLHALMRTMPDLPVISTVVIGRPADAIARTADEINAGLIVMGTHGREALGHLLIGSVADRVIRLARCPVMTVREFGAVRLSKPEAASPVREPVPQA